MREEARSGVRASRSGAAAVLAAVAIWGVVNVLIKLSPLPALTFGANRLWMGTALLALVTLGTGRRITPAMLRASAPGGILLGAEMALWFSAVKRTTLADAAVISALQPALVLLAAGPLFGERVTARDVAWMGLATAGAVLVSVGSSGTPAWSLSGDLLAAASLLAWTGYFLVSKRARRTVPPLQYMAVVFGVAALLMTPLAALAGQPLLVINRRDLLMLAVFVVGASSGHVLLSWAHASVDVWVSSLLTLLQPVVAAIAARAFLGEPITPLAAAGGAVVIGALAAIARRAAVIGEPEEVPPAEPPL
ncbi:MAG TPA: DMT family transporter [Actinomycetota bacterium]|nr:DMT family transporter [Actinomycetota bacterium]